MRIPLRVALLLLAVLSASAAIGRSDAATRVALVGGETDGSLENALDTATALLSKDADLQLLDRAEVDRVLREHELSLAGLERAEHAVKAAQLLQADLLAVLEGSLVNEIGGSMSLGLVVFDAKTGVRYADSALLASNTTSAASATAAAVQAAVVKFHRNPEDLHAVGVLLVRNSDLPRQFDGLCDSVGLLLERELTASPGIAVLERRRLEQVTKERSIAPDAEDNRLLSSLRMIELDISRDGDGLRGTLALAAADGARSEPITASVPTRDAAALAHLLADKTELFLKAPSVGLPPDRAAEAARFHREYELLLQHRDYIAAVHPFDAAIALAPEQTGWRREMALLLTSAAIELVDPAGQNALRSIPVQPSPEALASCLALGQRGADLILDLAREAVAATKPGGPYPDVLSGIYHYPLCQLLSKLAGVTTGDAASAAEIAALVRNERTLRIEITEPFLYNWSVNRASFFTYSVAIAQRFSWGWEAIRSRLNPEEAHQDDVLALSHWVELSHKFNPPDGGGNYSPLIIHGLGYDSQWVHDESFRQTLERDQDPVIRLYAHASKVVTFMTPTGYSTDGTLDAEREFRLWAQEQMMRGEAATPGPLRDHFWRAIASTLYLLVNHAQYATEHLEACRFAFAQGDIQLDLFYRAQQAFDLASHRDLNGKLELVTGALKLILEKPEAYPKNDVSRYWERNAVIKDLQQTRDHLTAGIAAAEAGAGSTPATNVAAPSPWKQKTCLFDLTTPINGYAWLFKPMVQDGQVFAVALGFHEWGLPEDSVQLVRVPLEGGARAFLGQAPIKQIEWDNRDRIIQGGPQSRLTDTTPRVFDVGRAACVGDGCYFAATCSGVYIFPTNGGPVLHLGETNGLPSDDTHAVAFLDGKLYIGMGELAHDGYVASYDPNTKQIMVLASSRRSERISPFDDQPPFRTDCIVADSVRHRLLLAVSSANRSGIVDPCMGIWSYQPAGGEFKRLAPVRLPMEAPVFIQYDSWAGLANTNTLAVKELHTMALFDLHKDRLISVCDLSTPKTNAASQLWRKPVPGSPGNWTINDGPFFLFDGWFYSARPFERMALADGTREELPPLRTAYPLRLWESLQLLPDGKHVLAADQFSIWLLELNPETARAPAGSDNNNSALAKPSNPASSVGP